MSLPNPGESPRTEINRLKQRSVSDRDAMYEILDSTILCHIGYVESGQPYVLPYAFVRDGDRILIHGSSGARFMRELAKGAPTCITVTKLDGLAPGRTLEVRKSTNKELAATTLLSVSLAEASVKIRSGMPQDDEGSGTGVWSGVIPLHLVAGEPIPADEEAKNLPIPQSVKEFRANPKG